mmetsp:Transcript_7828/g.20026  ORF Transcript_7828/g.20026 Transcript_7828/m.20026 type:complete len:211 (-) Transcript_7828:22-654(-)
MPMPMLMSFPAPAPAATTAAAAAGPMLFPLPRVVTRRVAPAPASASAITPPAMVRMTGLSLRALVPRPRLRLLPGSRTRGRSMLIAARGVFGGRYLCSFGFGFGLCLCHLRVELLLQDTLPGLEAPRSLEHVTVRQMGKSSVEQMLLRQQILNYFIDVGRRIRSVSIHHAYFSKVVVQRREILMDFLRSAHQSKIKRAENSDVLEILVCN